MGRPANIVRRGARSFVSLALFLGIGALEVLDHHLTIGGLVSFNALVVLANGPIAVVLSSWDEFQYSRVLLDRLADILEAEPEQGADHTGLRDCSTRRSPRTSPSATTAPTSTASSGPRGWPTPTTSSDASPLATRPGSARRGCAFPGGQRQRIAIARAIYHRPSVLILDEATSALDSESERAVKEGLGELLQGRTSFIIAHRLSTVRDADVIIVLEKGRLVEQGTHEQLMAHRGLYYYLSSQQLEL